MTNNQVCRICLAHDTRMYTIANIRLEIFYQNITNKPFNIEGEKPSVVCYICYHSLKKCHRFSECAIRADEVLQEIRTSGLQITQLCVSRIHNPFTALKTSPVSNFNVTRAQRVMSADDDISEVKVENLEDPLDMNIAANNVTEIPIDITLTTTFEIKRESELDKGDLEEEKADSEHLVQSYFQHSPDISDLSPVKTAKLNEVNGTFEIIPDKGTDATEIPIDIIATTHNKSKKRKVLDIEDTEEIEAMSSNEMLQLYLHHSLDLEDDEPLKRDEPEEDDLSLDSNSDIGNINI